MHYLSLTFLTTTTALAAVAPLGIPSGFPVQDSIPSLPPQDSAPAVAPGGSSTPTPKPISYENASIDNNYAHGGNISISNNPPKRVSKAGSAFIKGLAADPGIEWTNTGSGQAAFVQKPVNLPTGTNAAPVQLKSTAYVGGNWNPLNLLWGSSGDEGTVEVACLDTDSSSKRVDFSSLKNTVCEALLGTAVDLVPGSSWLKDGWSIFRMFMDDGVEGAIGGTYDWLMGKTDSADSTMTKDTCKFMVDAMSKRRESCADEDGNIQGMSVVNGPWHLAFSPNNDEN